MSKMLQVLAAVWLKGTAELVVYFPPLILLGHWFIPAGHFKVWALHLMVYYPTGFVFMMLIKRSKYWLIGIAAAALSFSLSYLANGLSLSFMIGGLLGVVLFLRGVQAYGKQWYETFPSIHFWIGLIIAAFSALVMYMIAIPQQYYVWFQFSTLITIVLTLFVTNQHMLAAEAHHYQRKAVSPVIVKQNRVMTFVLLIVILFISLFRQLSAAFKWMLLQLRNEINAWLARMSAHQNQPAPAPPKPMPQMPHLTAGHQQASPFWHIVSVALITIAMVIAGAAAIFMLYLIVKKVLMVFPWLKQFFSRSRQASQNEGFQDEETNLLNLQDWTQLQAGKVREWMDRMRSRAMKWDELGNNEARIRWLYRWMIKDSVRKGYHFHKSLTPLETEEDLLRWNEKTSIPVQEIVRLYNQTRYQEQAANDEEVRRVWDKS